MSIHQNPLQQYFRRPAIYITLPSGGAGYSPGVIEATESGELPVYPMTAIDEITINTPDALFNGEAVAQVIASCIPHIRNPWALQGSDLDAVLVAIKIATGGAKMDVDSTCPKCEHNTKYEVHLPSILTDITAGDYSKPLQIGDLHFLFRSLSYKEINATNAEQFAIQKQMSEADAMEDIDGKMKVWRRGLLAVTDLTMRMVASMIATVLLPSGIRVEDNAQIYDYLKNADKKTYETIRDYAIKLKESSEVKPLHITCQNCTHEYDQGFTLNASNFFA